MRYTCLHSDVFRLRNAVELLQRLARWLPTSFLTEVTAGGVWRVASLVELDRIRRRRLPKFLGGIMRMRIVGKPRCGEGHPGVWLTQEIGRSRMLSAGLRQWIPPRAG